MRALGGAPELLTLGDSVPPVAGPPQPAARLHVAVRAVGPAAAPWAPTAAQLRPHGVPAALRPARNRRLASVEQ
eukprot:11212102-Heterocapsa_arctica.AAC.1